MRRLNADEKKLIAEESEFQKLLGISAREKYGSYIEENGESYSWCKEQGIYKEVLSLSKIMESIDEYRNRKQISEEQLATYLDNLDVPDMDFILIIGKLKKRGADLFDEYRKQSAARFCSEMNECSENKTMARKIIDAVNDDIEELLEVVDNRKQNPDAITFVDEFLEKKILLENGKYIIDGKMVNIESELLDYFEHHEETVQAEIEAIYGDAAIDHTFEISEKEELESLPEKMECYILYAQFVKWRITENDRDLAVVINLLTDDMVNGFLFPVDKEEYWRKGYLRGEEIGISKKLVDSVVYAQRFYDTYAEYISLFVDSNGENLDIDLYQEDDVWEKDYLVEKIAETEDKGLSADEYYSITRDLSEEEKISTGKSAFLQLVQNYEKINIEKWILKDLAKRNPKYDELYKQLSRTQRKLVDFAEKIKIDYEDISPVEKAVENVPKYREQYLLDLMVRIISCVADSDLTGLLQCKNAIVPLCARNSEWLKKTIEDGLKKVEDQIKNVVSDEKEFVIILENIGTKFGGVLQRKVIKTLATAEYLYQRYIDVSTPNEELDYSFISLLYYQVLEEAGNVLIYQRYKDEIGNKIDAGDIKRLLGDVRCTSRNGRGKVSLKDSLELGPIGYLFRQIESTDALREFVERTYPLANLSELSEIGREIIKAAKRRNDAAHPGVITYQVATEDKSIVYENCGKSEAREMHDLFVRMVMALGML